MKRQGQETASVDSHWLAGVQFSLVSPFVVSTVCDHHPTSHMHLSVLGNSHANA